MQTLFNQPSQKKWICKSESIVLHFLPKGFVVIEILSEIGEYVIFQKNNVWYSPFSCVSLMSFFTLYLTTKRNSETFLKVMKICLKRKALGSLVQKINCLKGHWNVPAIKSSEWSLNGDWNQRLPSPFNRHSANIQISISLLKDEIYPYEQSLKILQPNGVLGVLILRRMLKQMENTWHCLLLS